MHDFFSKYHIDDEVIAAGVSGGADSLALILRLQDWAVVNHHKVVALTVDHRLRSESRAEAEYVANLMQQYGIEHHILTWEAEKPQSDVEAKARTARYELIKQWCDEHDVKTLAMGHHRRDQAETFLLRLQRGSGLYGLSGILPVSEREGLQIIRPQLEDSPEFLRSYLQNRNIKWVEDPSNQCEEYQRVKIRKFLPELEKAIGLTEARLAETASVLARTREYMDYQVETFINAHVRNWHNVAVSVPKSKVTALHQEMAYRVLGHLIRNIGKKAYAPEAEELLRLVTELQKDDFSGCTLGDCELFVTRGRLWIVPELKCKEVMYKTAWEDFAKAYPNYINANLPYKVRQALYCVLAKI